MSKVLLTEDYLTDIASAIREKNGSSTLYKLAAMGAAIRALTSSSGGTSSTDTDGDIRFLDYDGTIVAAYSIEEANALTELPELPTHAGLTAQGWNYSLESVQGATHAMDIGATYVTDDGKTRFYLQFDQSDRLDFPLYFSQDTANGVIIDWGDGSDTETLDGTGVVNTTHTYPGKGSYVLTLEVTAGTLSLSAGGSYNLCGTDALTYLVYLSVIYGVEIGTNVSIIDTYYFVNCPFLETITISDSVTSIGGYAFYGCSYLTSVIIPESITSIKDCTFYFCFSLTSVSIPESVTSIGSYVFYMCLLLKSVIIPKNIASMGYYLVRACTSLTSFVIPEGITDIGTYAFYDCYLLKSIYIPEGITSIGNYTFYECNALRDVVIPESVTSIGTYAFYDCYTLTSVNIPESVTSIGNYAFYKCYCLKSITIPKNITSIAASAFNNCRSLHSIILKPTTPPTLSSTNAFNNIPDDCIIYVPAGCLEAYQSATNWATYADYMVEMTE